MPSLTKMKLEANKLRRENIRLNRENNDLKRQLFNYSQDLVAYRKLTTPAKLPPDPMLDKEMVELLRVRAWSENSKSTEHVNEDGDGYSYPDGWPEGVVAEEYVGAFHDHEPGEASETPGPTDSILHGLLRG